MSAAERAETKPTGANHNLWQIAKQGDVIQLEQALARGADVNACNNLGLTPLMMAAYHGQTVMVKALVEHGADINAVDNGGLTAAMLAEDSDHGEVVRTLVALGVKKRPAVPQPESAAVPDDKAEAVGSPQQVSKPKDPVVRTLGEPPEIWDLVQETRSEFKPSSTITERLFRLHPLVLTGILVVIGCGVGVFFAALGTRSNTATVTSQTEQSAPASLPPTVHSAKSPLKESSPLTDRTPASAKQEPTKAPSRTSPVRPTIDALRLFVAGVGAEASREQVAAKPEVDNEGMANHARVASESSEDGARPAPRSSRTSVALSRNNRRAALGRQADDDNGDARTVAKQAEKAPSQESISPPKPDPTPKPKVIPWP